MRHKPYQTVAVSALMLMGIAAFLGACAFGGNSPQTTYSAITTSQAVTSAVSTTPTAVGPLGSEAQAYSTFQSKDPFIQQALPPTSSTTPTTPSGETTTTGFTTTTLYTTTTYYVTTTTSNNTTTTEETTTTTVAHTHTLEILSVSTVSDAAVVTFMVDSTTYQDKHAGDVVSTTWGQIKVLDINTSSNVVTLLHGSETLTLVVGQSTFE